VAFDPDPPPITDDAPPSRHERSAVDQARPPPKKPKRLISTKEMLERVNLSWPSVKDRVKAGTFPEPRKPSPRKFGWVEDEIDEWIANPELWIVNHPRRVEGRSTHGQVQGRWR